MKKFSLLLSIAVMAIGLFTSCDYEIPYEYEKLLLPHFAPVFQAKDVPSDGFEIGHGYLAAVGADSLATEGVTEMQFVAVGKGKTVTKITAVPAEGWLTDTIPAAANNGYLIRYHKYGTEGWLYRRFYIKEYILLGGDDWYGKVQFDKRDWNPLANY